MFNIYLGGYIIFSIWILVYGPYKLFNEMNLPIAALIFFIFSLILLIVFGIKWFNPTGPFSKTPVSWPPMINTCPDFLIYYNRVMPDKTNQDTCIDTIGVSKNGALSVYPQTGVPTDNKYYFPLVTKSTDKVARNAELCKNAIAYGLTWEGITNGEGCVGSDGKVSGVASGSNKC
jgi:hypothetical protein